MKTKTPTTSAKNAEDGKETGTRRRFLALKFLEKLDLREKDRMVRFGKWLLFALLILVEGLILLQQISASVQSGNWAALVAAIGIETVLTVSEAVKLFAVKGFRNKICCYLIDFVAAFVLTAVTGSTYLCTLYMVVLTEFYVSSEKTLPSVVACEVCMVVYVITFGASNWLHFRETVSVVRVITQSFNDLVVLAIHFIVMYVSVRFYRQYLRLSETMKELDESRAKLQKAYDELAEVAALEERQRIAKDIHDTAGHSITTVIMQTEAAKLIVEERPEEAKEKIIAANLQAKHALEELRESVHLLSGVSARATLKTELTAIINESADGTGVKFRSEIDDVDVSEEKYRFICNALREGISNGLRHGHATAFWFELKESDGKIGFLLSDNGAGADMGRLKRGFGLTSMAQHAERLGGTLTLSSEEGEGLEIRVFLPSDKRGAEEVLRGE